jgi:hypothetical protein
MRSVSRVVSPSSRRALPALRPRSADVDEARVAAGHANLDVAGRELLAELERGLAQHVEEADLDRRFERSPQTFEGRGRGLVRACERLQVAEDRVKVRPEVHQRASRRSSSGLIVFPCMASPCVGVPPR